jgi:hypothetical protein
VGSVGSPGSPASPQAASLDSPAAPQAASSAAPVSSLAGPAALQALVAAVRKEKLALAASLEKAESLSLEGGELRLVYRPKDRYPGVQVYREKEEILRHAAAVFTGQGVTRLRVDYAGAEPGAAPNHQAEMVKKIFRGEVVKGE